MNPHRRMPELISRRKLLMATAAMLLPRQSFALADVKITLGWRAFEQHMNSLARDEASKRVNQETVEARGIQYLQQLDTGAADYKQAVENAYETGNRYWLWQRMIKADNLNGGILTIANDQLVQLHDHPGATGMLRIISGEVEVWQFDVASEKTKHAKKNIEELKRVNHQILKKGDTAVLSPHSGNIHALKAISKECRMLDFFIPPYKRNQRSWYEPLTNDWFNKKRIACRKISQDEHTQA